MARRSAGHFIGSHIRWLAVFAVCVFFISLCGIGRVFFNPSNDAFYNKASDEYKDSLSAFFVG